jgi:hypothetical protein
MGWRVCWTRVLPEETDLIGSRPRLSWDLFPPPAGAFHWSILSWRRDDMLAPFRLEV